MKNDSFLNRHLNEAGESYGGHLCFTTKTAGRLILGGITIFIHGLLPFLFEHTGSNLIDRVNADLKARRETCEKNRK